MMTPSTIRIFLPSLVTAVTVVTCDAQKTDPPGDTFSLQVSAEQALAALTVQSGPLDLNAEPPSAELRALLGQASRGPAATVFPTIAPSVVVVRAGSGYGTGFVVGADGWILTNNHVIASAMIDIETGSRFAHIHFGDLKDGFMSLDKQAHLAFVFAASPQKDLALLKLYQRPDSRTLEPIVFAENNAGPGADCFTIGHPSRGMFWSLRSGEVVGVGQFPGDMIDSVMPQFAMTAAARQSFVESLRQSESRKALISSIGINPGDSGGPLLNMDGELIAVNFAIPMSEKDSQVSLDKFSYHVHLDEVKTFAVDRPQSAEVFEPNIWAPAASSTLQDRDGDDIYETWFFGLKEGEPASGLIWDLDDDTPTSFLEDFKAQKADRSQFEYEVAFTRVPTIRLFYDRNNDGEVDLILTDMNNDGNSNLSIEKTDGGWKKIVAPQKMLDPLHFESLALQERFKRIVLNQPQAAQPTPIEPADSPPPNTSAPGDESGDGQPRQQQ